MPHLNEHHDTWIGRMLTDAWGHKIGKIDDIYNDDDTGQPEWLAVTTGIMGPTTHFVPMREASVSGGGVQVPFPKDQVKVAPSAGTDGRLSRREKGRLYAHYGYSCAEERNRLQRALGTDQPDLTRPAVGSVLIPRIDPGGPRRDVSRPPGRRDEPDELPAASRAGGRGRWPDDEAIFGLSPEVARTA